MSAELEATYRRALKWYPKRWRAANADAVVGTLLDQADDDKRSTPARGELTNLRTNAIARRLGLLGRIPAPVRDRAAALAFGLGVGVSIVALIVMPIHAAEFDHAPFSRYLTMVGPYIGFSFVFYALWILALIAAVVGWKWVARAIALAGIPVSIVLHVAFNTVLAFVPTTTTIVLFAILAVMTLLGNPFATRRGRLWVGLSALGWAAFVGLTIAYQQVTKGGGAGRTDWFVGTFWLWLEWVIPPALIFALLLWTVRRSPWGPAVVVMLIPLTAFALFGWHPILDDLLDKATLMGLAIAFIAIVFVVIEFARGNLRLTSRRS